jgi:hypothetical protein
MGMQGGCDRAPDPGRAAGDERRFASEIAADPLSHRAAHSIL